MRRFRLNFAFIVFLLLFNTACNTSQTTSIIACFGSIAIPVVASKVTEEPVPLLALLPVVPACVDAAIITFASPSNANPSSPIVDINQSPKVIISTASLKPYKLSNCQSGKSQKLQIALSLPALVIVGQSPGQGKYELLPRGTSDNDLIAQQLFKKYSSDISKTVKQGTKPPISLDVPPGEKISLTVSVQVPYKEGEARIIHTDGSIVGLPWLLVDGFPQSGQINSTFSSCS